MLFIREIILTIVQCLVCLTIVAPIVMYIISLFVNWVNSDYVEEKSKKYRIYRVYNNKVEEKTWEYILQKKGLIYWSIADSNKVEKGCSEYKEWVNKYGLR